MTATNIATVKDINAALLALGHQPLPTDAVRAISQTARDPFLTLLMASVQDLPDPPDAKKKLSDWLLCVSNDSRAKVVTLGFPENLLAIAAAGHQKPARFLSALNVAADSKHPKFADAKQYLADLLAAPMNAAASPTEPPAPAQTSNEPPASEPAPPPAVHNANPARADQKEFDVHHVYGSNFALCFNAILGQDGRPGIMVDAAVFADSRYRWDGAIHFWLNEREIDGVLAVFRRWRRSIEFTGHGRRNDKTFRLEFQKTHFFCSVIERGASSHATRAVKILGSDARMVAMQVMKQLMAAQPAIPPSELFETIRAVHSDVTDTAAA